MLVNIHTFTKGPEKSGGGGGGNVVNPISNHNTTPQNFTKFSENTTTLPAEPIFSKILPQEFLPHLTFLSEFSKFLVKLFASVRKLRYLQIFWKRFQEILLPLLYVVLKDA